MPDARGAQSRDPEGAPAGGRVDPSGAVPAAELPAGDLADSPLPGEPGPQSPRDPAVGDRVLYHAAARGINLPVGDPAGVRLVPYEAEVIEWPVRGHPPGTVRLRLLLDGEEHAAAYAPEPAERCWSWPPPP